MTSFELWAMFFVACLAAIVFGIFAGIAIAERRRQKEAIRADNTKLEAVRNRAFARLNRSSAARRPRSPKGRPADIRSDVLDAEVIE